MLPLKKKKLLTYVLVFDQYHIIRKTLDFMTAFSDQLEIVIIENPSPNSPKIKKLIDSYGNAGKLKRHYLFEDNIAANVFSVVLERERSVIKKHSLVMLTDGDLICKDGDWLKEEISILKHNPSVFVCGVSLNSFNLPIKTFPEAKNWIPLDISEQEDYFEARTGLHLLTLSSTDLLGFLDWFKAHEHPFVDSTLHYYCYDILGKKWARTKKAKARHLTWDLYGDLENSYTRLKTSKSHKEMWFHLKKADFSLKEY
ncbi:MAG: hypothetical protein JWS12_943 [Candidatus Saccharibacteria bacterium]|nr:hypothetical protein [Candidatus Saccharibacteria bacterium]